MTEEIVPVPAPEMPTRQIALGVNVSNQPASVEIAAIQRLPVEQLGKMVSKGQDIQLKTIQNQADEAQAKLAANDRQHQRTMILVALIVLLVATIATIALLRGEHVLSEKIIIAVLSFAGGIGAGRSLKPNA